MPRPPTDVPRRFSPWGFGSSFWVSPSLGLQSPPSDTSTEAPAPTPIATTPTAAPTGGPAWEVQDGDLTFAVTQMGAPVVGNFATWSAAITYDEATGTGAVTVDIDTTTLTLGSVTDNAKGAEFFNVAAYSTATFAADITPHRWSTSGVRHSYACGCDGPCDLAV